MIKKENQKYKGHRNKPFDKMLGTTCAEVLNSKKYGVMLAIQNEAIGCVPLEEVVRKKKFVPIDHPLITAARLVETRFGD